MRSLPAISPAASQPRVNPPRLFSRLAPLALAAGVLLGSAILSAQETPSPAAPGPVAAADDDAIQLQFPNNSIADVLGVYELLTGKAIIKETGIFEGPPISLVTASPITKEEAIELIESSLQLNGYVLSESQDGNSIRVALATTLQPNITRGLRVHESPDTLPKGHTMATYFLKLEHLDPAETATTLWSHLGLNKFGRITPVASPPGILITENADNIRQILRVTTVLDVPQDESELKTEFYQLKYADAVVVGQVLSSTFATRQKLPTITTDTMGDGESRIPTRLAAEVLPRVVSDDRLNRIMLVAQERDHVYARDVIKKFDQPLEDMQPLERRLKYVFVDQVLPVLVDILQDSGVGTSTLAGGEVVRSRRPPQASSDPATLAGRPRRGPAQREGARTAPAGYEDELNAPEENTAPISVLVGKTRLVADVQSNKLIAYGPSEDQDKIVSLLDRLDRKPPQVYLSTIIGQLSLGDGYNVGVDYLREFKAGGNGDAAGSMITWDTLQRAVTDVRNPIPVPPLNPAKGLNIYGQIADGFDVYIRALESTQRFKVLSRPAIYAANNKKALITSGRRIPVPTSSITDLSNTSSVRTNIEYQDVVLKLEVIPLINSNREVSLTIAQTNDTVDGQQQVAENTVPIIGTERLVTTVTVANRSTIVLGGLITENEEKTTSGVPVLSRIPLLGHAFKSTSSEKRRRELLIFIQPVVVEDNEQAEDASLGENIRTKIGTEAGLQFRDFSLPEDASTGPDEKRGLDLHESLLPATESSEPTFPSRTR